LFEQWCETCKATTVFQVEVAGLPFDNASAHSARYEAEITDEG
jgi:hypothetical protein